eukprot:3507486-Rhodomonas_salina.1
MSYAIAIRCPVLLYTVPCRSYAIFSSAMCYAVLCSRYAMSDSDLGVRAGWRADERSRRIRRSRSGIRVYHATLSRIRYHTFAYLLPHIPAAVFEKRILAVLTGGVCRYQCCQPITCATASHQYTAPNPLCPTRSLRHARY